MQQSHTFSVYIAASSAPSEVERAKQCGARLTAAGVNVVSTWTAAVDVHGGNPRDAAVGQRRHWAARDLLELGRADALWLLCPPTEAPTRGAWVELGAAYMRAMLVVSSGDTRQSIFTALTEEFATDEDAHDALVLVAAKRTAP